MNRWVIEQIEELLFYYRNEIDDKIMEGEEYTEELNEYRILQRKYYDLLEG